VEGLYVGDESSVYDFVVRQLGTVGYVNLVRGDMEFGPRALCHTSTIARPEPRIVNLINAMNDRNTVMPMAPVVNRKMYHALFEDTHKVWESHKHMVIAMEYAEYPYDWYSGVAHSYTNPYRHHTGRPQVVDRSDTFMDALLDEFGGVLINTSFNYHGRPIALGMDSVVSNHMAEHQHNSSITTAVISNE
jgi:carbamoyltransferase